VAVVNPTTEPRRLRLDLAGATVGEGPSVRPDGSDRLSHNAPGRPRGVTVTETTLPEGGDTLEAPPLSAVLHVLPAR